MDIEEKKFLAEWMGWRIEYHGGGEVIDCPQGRIPGIMSFREWNPDTDHKQFAEVWNEMCDVQQGMVERLVEKKVKLSGLTIDFVSELLNDLPKVMDAVLEVIKESSGA